MAEKLERAKGFVRGAKINELIYSVYGPQIANSAFSHIVFYYGKCSIPKPFSVTGAELDDHFGWPIHDAVEEVNEYFRGRLFSILSGAK